MISYRMPKKTKKKRRSYKKTLSTKTYQRFIRQKQKKRLSKKNTKKLSRELNRKYCKCVKRVRKSLSAKKKGAEYPICTTSVYKQRGFVPPKDKNKNC